MNEAVLFEQRDNIAVITINRPGSRNAINGDVAAGLQASVDRLDTEPALAVGIITGAGGTFCSGMDLKAFARGETAPVTGRGFAGITAQPPGKPVIAAVEGWAVAGGFEIVLSCDLVVASMAAQFGLPEVTRGLIASAGGLLRLPKALPYHQAMLAALTGDALSAEALHRFGVVSLLTAPGDALAGALELAARIAANAPLAVVASKQVVSGSIGWTEAAAFAEQDRLGVEISQSQDAREGAQAFAAKRAPRWVGA